MKKTKIVSLILVLVLAVSLFAACAGESDAYYGQWVKTKDPTCTEVGVETRTAIGDAENTQSRYIPARGHDFDTVGVVYREPTTTEVGIKRYYCLHNCGEYIEEEIPKLDPPPTPPDDGGEHETVPPPAPPEIPSNVVPNEVGVFILGGYAKYITEEKVYAIISDFTLYCEENAIARKVITYRMYGADLDVAGLSNAVKADTDMVDALIGVGNNINSTGTNLDGYVTGKSAAVTIYFDGSANDDTRRHARMNDEDLTQAYWTYIALPRATAILTAQHPYPALTAPLTTIPADAEGVFVLGAYARYISEEKTCAVINGFKEYVAKNAISHKFISYRMYEGASLSVADFSTAIKSTNDADALIGVGNNINSSGNLDGGYIKEKSAAAVTIFNGGLSTDASRYHARTNDEALTMAYWTYIATPEAVALLAAENCAHEYQAGVCVKCGAIKPVTNARVLLVGNSYTYYNDHMLADTLTTLAADARVNLTVDELSNGSAHLQYYINGQYAADLAALLTANTYDYIVLQEQSNYPVGNKDAFKQRILDLKQLIGTYQNQANAEIILYMTWARRADDTEYYGVGGNPATPQAMEDKLYEAYSAAATAASVKMSPVGRAFGLMRGESSVEMYNPDKTHPSREGSYLAALTLYSTIFSEKATLVRYIPDDITTAASVLLREAAQRAVTAG